MEKFTEKIIVEGNGPLKGSIRVGGSKNAVLPILAGCLLTQEDCKINEVPYLADVVTITTVLEGLGAKVSRGNGTVLINAGNTTSVEAPYEIVRKMRASFLIMGPLLARMGQAKISLPGGCAIGTRPIDLHLKGFATMGAEIICGHGYIEAKASKLKGARVYLDFPSVGATENIMMAATLAEGVTLIENAAEEPEIVDLANFLNSMGAKVRGAGTKIIKIEGVKALHGTEYNVIPDRIEGGTYMVAAALTRGNIFVENIIIDHLKPVVAKLQEIGAEVFEEGDGIRVIGREPIVPVVVKTLPYPGFPTDMQAQFMALTTVAEGTSIITETVFENRFMHVDELKRMGAKISIEGRTAVIEGVSSLTGAPVKATDLRAGAALILSGMIAEGETEIGDIYHIDRGYDNIVGKLLGIGAKIKRIKIEDKGI